ncbi:predicted protein [Histoplasma capsulatum G186AR]|uniref:Uncharacterized protein n=1 Tax=Ajellomyces capsulatus (strain G186AR / H82 / ATCC MYA-2454 / RMSCC 2432) TaxID=447093 RepID=C0NN20_AJECG|nr:uncharacterized protein HCBG_04147 [Histoplasma capsulatum G186AR]EEH07268.1 predicted protein [Histoplasma capsulatum G186AR]
MSIRSDTLRYGHSFPLSLIRYPFAFDQGLSEELVLFGRRQQVSLPSGITWKAAEILYPQRKRLLTACCKAALAFEQTTGSLFNPVAEDSIGTRYSLALAAPVRTLRSSLRIHSENVMVKNLTSPFISPEIIVNHHVWLRQGVCPAANGSKYGYE